MIAKSWRERGLTVLFEVVDFLVSNHQSSLLLEVEFVELFDFASIDDVF